MDLLFAASGIEAEIAADASDLVVLGGVVPVATVGHLIAMKLLSRDPKKSPRDENDRVALAGVADASEWARAEDAVGLIGTRGFARGRDLKAALAELRTRASSPE